MGIGLTTEKKQKKLWVISCLIYIYTYVIFDQPSQRNLPQQIGLPGMEIRIETFWKKSKEMRNSCGVKCWKKPAPKRNKEKLINMLCHPNKTLCWINMLIKSGNFFPVLDKHEVSGFPVLVIFCKVVIFLTAAPDSTRKEGCFPEQHWPLQARNKVDRSQLVWYEPIPGSAKKGWEVFLRCRLSWNLGPNWLDKNL